MPLPVLPTRVPLIPPQFRWVEPTGLPVEAFARFVAFVDAWLQRFDVQTFTTGGTWTKPSAGTFAHIEIIGAAGGGARRSAGNGSGGGGGSYFDRWLPLSSLGATETITIGTGGAVQATDNTNGNAGGTTSFGAWLIVYGGRGGVQAAAGNAVSGGGSSLHYDAWAAGASNISGAMVGQSVPGNVAINIAGPFGSSATGVTAANAVATVSLVAQRGGPGGAGHSTTGPVSGVQNTSQDGGNGGAGNGAGAGGNGVTPGGGGGSGTTQGGSGGNGQVKITVF